MPLKQITSRQFLSEDKAIKLPDIQYGGTPGVGNAPSPQQAVTETAQKFNILGKAQKAAQEISTAYTEYNVTKADNGYASEMAEFRKEAAKLDQLSPGEIAALDLDIDTEGRDKINKAEWYPKLLAKRMEEYKGKYAATITSPAYRNKWEAEVTKNDNKILEREIEIAAKETKEFLAVERLDDVKDYIARGEYDSAENALTDSFWTSSPKYAALKEEFGNQILEEREISKIYERFETMDVDVIEDTLAYMSSPEYLESSAIGLEKRRAVRDLGYSRLVAINASNLKEREQAGDNLRMDLEIQMYTNPESFDPRQISENKTVLGQSNVSALLAKWQSQVSGESQKVVTPGWVDSQFETMAFRLQFGVVPEGSSYQEEWAKVANFVNEQTTRLDPETGRYIPVANSVSLAKMSTRLQELKDEPFTNLNYKDQVKYLDLMVLRYDSENPFSIRPDPSSSPAYLEGLASLKAYAAEHGPNADLAAWNKAVVPGLMRKEAQSQLMKLPAKVQRMAVSASDANGPYIDGDATRAKYEQALRVQQQNYDSGNSRDKQEAESAMRRLRQELATWDEYANGVGASYVR